MSTALVTLTNKLAAKFGMENSDGVMDVLKATAFRGQVSDAQMTALMVVANQYGLNPWCREIYAFPDKNNGIVPVVGVDGWSRIINEHPQLDGIEFEYGPQEGKHHEWVECVIYRKDRSHPIRAREFWSEVYRDNAQPWKSHPNRMHRHKSLIQCARIAFGFAGIYDQDEAERIVEKDMGTVDRETGEVKKREEQVLPPCHDDKFKSFMEKGGNRVKTGESSAEEFIAWLAAKFTLREDQVQAIYELEKQSIDASFVEEMNAAEGAQ